IGTRALREPDWFAEMCRQFPGRIALGLDAKDSMVATHGWLEVSGVSAIDLARSLVGLPLAAVIYTNIANDGMMQGIDNGTLDDFLKLAELGLPVIASGGVTTMKDLAALKSIAEKNSGLIGAITGRAIYEGTIQVREAIQFLAS
ncbi:MAG: HisA/HisF-related TIM barrel protein, partial [Planctomyces sp.]